MPRGRPNAGVLWGFCGGIFLSHVVPSAWTLVSAAVGAGLVVLCLPRFRIIAGALLGFAYAAHHLDDLRICDGPVEGLGDVVSMVERTELGVRFVFRFDTANRDCRLVHVSYYGDAEIRPGESLKVAARVRPAHGLFNPAGFDMERWYRAGRVEGVGTVDQIVHDIARDTDAVRSLLGRARRAILEIRAHLAAAVDARPLVYSGVIKALVLGDDSGIEADARERFRDGGVVHLLVVSGLHVAVVAGLAFGLARLVAPMTPFHPTYVGAAVAILVAGAYVGLTGAGLPIVRAYVMTVAVLLALFVGRRIDGPTTIVVACTGVFLIDPLAPLDVGFWLSFGAVVCLTAYFRPRVGPSSPVRTAWEGQWVMSTLFLPWTSVLVGAFAPLGFFANVLLVPMVSIVVVPLALMGVVGIDTSFGHVALIVSDFAIAVVVEILGWFDTAGLRFVGDARAALVAVLVAAATLMLPSPLIVRAMGVASVVVLLTADGRARVTHGEFHLHVLDVGQGLAVLVQTREHNLLYDAGARFRGGGDMAERVVLPMLAATGSRSLDAFLVSHDDNDHAGGAHRVLRMVDVSRFLAGRSSVYRRFGAARCVANDAWEWDGVRFRILYDGTDAMNSNDSSCVLLITSENGESALLPGDIERDGEERVLAALDAQHVGGVGMLLMPHHGSRTSSSEAFVSRVRPVIAVASTGFRNRFGHPHESVVRRYASVGTHVTETPATGFLSWYSDTPGEVSVARCERAPYWRLERLSLPCNDD